MAIRVLVVDDHSVVRKGLRYLFQADAEIEIVGEASDGVESLRLARELRPEVVLMDLVMPGMDGIQAITALRRDFPEVEVIALTSVLEDDMVVGAIRAGAIGYLLKNTEGETLRLAIKAAAAGKVQLSPEAAARLMREVRGPEVPERLTERETQVLRLLARGQSNKEIGQSLSISETTVKSHVSNILGKLGVSSRTHAALYALRSGLVSASASSDSA
jgi:DNA-binding NarL/FixJ family response regulator